MDKWISTVAVGAALALASSSAVAVDGNFFVNGEAAASNVDINNLQHKNDTSTAGALRLGYLWNAGPVSWGLEAGYADLGKVTGYNDYYGYDVVHASVKTQGELLGSNFKLHFGHSGWFFSARAGWFHSRTTARSYDDRHLGSYEARSNGDGFYLGTGMGYDFNRHIGVSLNYDLYQSRANGVYDGRFNTNVFGGTLEYRY
jgi:hypothetical protein